MSYISIYAIFAIATGLSAIIWLFLPARHKLKTLNPDDAFVTHPVTTGVTFFVISVVVAPIMLPAVIVPSISEAAISGMLGYTGKKL